MISHTLRGLIDHTAEIVATRRYRGDLRRRRAEATKDTLITERISAAVIGIGRLCDLGRSEGMKRVVSILGTKELMLWGNAEERAPKGDLPSITWTYGAHIIMTATAIEAAAYVKNNGVTDPEDSVFARFPYHSDRLLHATEMRKLATPLEVNLKQALRDRDISTLYSQDAVFQVLVSIGDETNCNRLVSLALTHKTTMAPF